MRALTWQGNLDVRVTDVPDPQIQEPNDAIIAVTSTAICGSDLHLYGVLGPYLSPGDVLGHETMGVVTEVGADITNLVPGDRVVIPFNISCGQFPARIAKHLGAERVSGVDPVPERRAAAARFGIEAVDLNETADAAGMLIEMTGGRGPDAVIDAVGMEAHGHDEAAGSKLAEVAQRATGLLPDRVAQKITDVAAVDRLDALHVAVKAVRRGGTVSVSGVYGGEVDPMPMMEMFDRGIQLRMGQAHVKRWIDDLMPMVTDGSEPLGVQAFATHRLSLEQDPHGYEVFRNQADGCIKVVLQP